MEATVTRKGYKSQKIKVASFSELDALVSEHVMAEAPEIHWEDSYVHMRFETLSEALEAMRDPYVLNFIPAGERANTTLSEVREFRHYSTAYNTAMDVVEKVSHEGDASLQLRRQGEFWMAAFGTQPEVEAPTVPAAICLAALRARGVVVEVEEETDESKWEPLAAM